MMKNKQDSKRLIGADKLTAYSLKIVKDNASIIEKILAKRKLTGLGRMDIVKSEPKKMSFEEVFKLYNSGLSDDEVKAWVWYRRSIGIPMKGWERYYLQSQSKNQEMVKVIKKTMIRDNHFREIRSIESGEVVGKYIKTHQYSDDLSYYIFRGNDGLYYINSTDCKIEKVDASGTKSEIDKLVKSGCLFYCNGEFLPYPIFAFGNIYDQERQLKIDRDFLVETYGESVYDNHVKILKEVKPSLLTITSPSFKDRPIITLVSDFAKDENVFSISTVRDEYNDVENAEELKMKNGQVNRKKRDEQRERISLDGTMRYSLQHVFVKWLFTLVKREFEESSAPEIVDYYIDKRALRNDDLKPEEKEEIKSKARNEGERQFAKFLHEVLTPEDQERLDYTWNSMYNGWSDIQYMRIPVGFECSRTFKSGIMKLTPIQREGIAFQEAVGSGINAFDVGVGKTMTAIAVLASNIYSGKCKRPLVVVPKPTYDKWLREIGGYADKKTKEFVSGVLSYTDIKINGWGNLGKEFVKANELTKRVEDKTITVVTYEGFKRLGFGENVSDDIFTELVNVLGQSKEKSARDAELDYQKYREMIGVGLKDTLADIDVLGFDFVILDEAHRCKNVFSGVRSEDDKKRYAMTGSQSELGLKAFMLLNYIQRKFGRNVMLLTATPFSNSPLEIYSMLSLVAYSELQKNGYSNLERFFNNFVLPTTEWAANYKEEIVQKEVVKSYINRMVLSRMIYNNIIYKTGEEAGVRRPCKINLPLLYEKKDGASKRLQSDNQILTYLNMTSTQRENQNIIVGTAQKATNGKLNKGLLFKALNFSLDNALSPFLYKDKPDNYLDFVQNSPKIEYVMNCIKSVREWHEKRKEPVSGQVIYMNRGKQYFHLIKEYLEEELGYQKGKSWGRVVLDEVEIITSDISDIKKENIKEAFLDGVVKIIIGTATIREGIDLQKRSTVLYNCYPDWNPTDIRQLEGRIWRQGNMFGYVRIVLPLLSDSMDVFVFQKLEEKTSRINDIWFKGNRGNVLDVESLDAEEIKLALITDVNVIVKMLYGQEKEILNRAYRSLVEEETVVKETARDIEEYNRYRAVVINLINSYYGSSIVGSSYFYDNASNRYTKEQIKRAKELKEAIELFIQKQNPEDKEILVAARRLENNESFGHFFSYKVNSFKEYLTKVKKAERTILKPRGFDLTSDLKPCIEGIKGQITEIQERAARDFTSETKKDEDCGRWKDLISEVYLKKSALSVTGKSPLERAIDFEKLNYLMRYRLDEMPQSMSCTIPSAKPDEDNEDDLEFVLLLEVEALEIELSLLNF
jgi:hypothetical protein